MSFALFFLAEYANIILMGFFISIVFLGGWLPFPYLDYIIPTSFHFIIKIFIIVFSFIWVRSTLPRFRFDQLMILGWKVLLPIAVLNIVITALVLLWKNGLY